MSFQIKGAGYQAKAMGANVKIARAMGETSKTMGAMNKQMDPAKVANTMKEFAMANDKMEMSEEMSEWDFFAFLCHENIYLWKERYIFCLAMS